MQTPIQDDVFELIEVFVRANFLDRSDDQTLTRTSPLLEWGILTSMNTAILMGYIRETFGVSIPPMNITAENFHDLQSIGDMVTALLPADVQS
jgi:acyl carrier protein